MPWSAATGSAPNRCWSCAVQASAIDVDARRNYAETLWHRGARDEALVQLKEARRLAGEDPGLAVRTGEMHLALGHVAEASQMVDEALRLDPKFASAWALARPRGRRRGANSARPWLTINVRWAMRPTTQDMPILVAETYRQLNEPQRALGALQSLAEHYSPGEEPQQVLYLRGAGVDGARSLRRCGANSRASRAPRFVPPPKSCFAWPRPSCWPAGLRNAQTHARAVLGPRPRSQAQPRFWPADRRWRPPGPDDHPVGGWPEPVHSAQPVQPRSASIGRLPDPGGGEGTARCHLPEAELQPRFACSPARMPVARAKRKHTVPT